MAEHGSKDERARATQEMSEMEESGKIMGGSTQVTFDPTTATMHVQGSNKPGLNNLAATHNMQVTNNVPKPILAGPHE